MLLYLLGMFGIAAFAITGVISSGKKDMDLFSVVFLGMVTSLGAVRFETRSYRLKRFIG